MATEAPSALATFIRRVVDGTGLDPAVVHAWVRAEGGPPDNPLNLMPGGKVARYGSPEAAAEATIRNLKTQGSYGPVLRAAANGGPREQLEAIASSPWDAGHYRGLDANGRLVTSNPVGASLFGAYTTLTGRTPAGGSGGGVGSAITGAAGAAAGAVGDAAGGVLDKLNPVDDVADAIGSAVDRTQTFLLDKALVALAYVVLSAASLALVMLGLTRASGVNPLQMLAAGRSARAAGGPSNEIPF